ncbi:MAG: trigger factor, partial [Flavobacteriaceae bacterium]|nr:trigger factor [Flavobacteriaceae bacterium]
LVLGSNNFIPGFEEQLIGVQKNDEKIVKVAFPENYGSKELSGKDAEFKCKIKEVSTPVLPKVDDQLAKKDWGWSPKFDLKRSIKRMLS